MFCMYTEMEWRGVSGLVDLWLILCSTGWLRDGGGGGGGDGGMHGCWCALYDLTA